jgi:predicted S18 family serine protease
MTLLSIAALEHRTIDLSVTLTGTIDEDGNVGAVGGTVEKATAANDYGITRFLLPLANRRLTIYERQTIDYRGFQLIDYVPRIVEAETYISKHVGINADYVDTIDDVLAIALK